MPRMQRRAATNLAPGDLDPLMLLVASILPCLALKLGPLARIPGRLSRMEKSLLAQAAVGGEGAVQLLRQFEQLEQAAPPPRDLLEKAGSDLEGRWQLVATIAGSRVGASVEELSESGVSGVVNASGISVRAEDAVQQIDLRSGRISNEVSVQPFGIDLLVRVAGTFEPAPPPAVRRALVEFDNLEVFKSDGTRLLSAGWLFALVRALKPSLTNGDADASWLETTYLSKNVRLGRGNKGSVFILRRTADEGPLPPQI